MKLCSILLYVLIVTVSINAEKRLHMKDKSIDKDRMKSMLEKAVQNELEIIRASYFPPETQLSNDVMPGSIYVQGGISLDLGFSGERILLTGLTDTSQVLPKYPREVSLPGSAVTDNGKSPVFCGGYGALIPIADCYKYDVASSSWIQMDSLSYIKVYPWSMTMDSQNEFYMSGGEEIYDIFYDMEKFDGQKFTSGPVELPYDAELCCAANMGNNQFILVDNYFETERAWTFDGNNNVFTEIEGLPANNSLWEFGCGAIENKNGDLEFVVAGGRSSYGAANSSSYIYNMGSKTWRNGPSLPKENFQPAFVQGTLKGRKTTLLVGGASSEIALTTAIVVFDADSESWQLRPEELRSPIIGHSAVLVSDTEVLTSTAATTTTILTSTAATTTAILTSTPTTLSGSSSVRMKWSTLYLAVLSLFVFVLLK